MPTVRSFDIFDTVLTRRVGAPEAVFQVVAEKLSRDQAIATSAVAFAEMRKSYEHRLNRAHGRHMGLRSIYSEMARSLSAEPSEAERWARAEERVESEITVPVPGAGRMIAEARSDGDQVIFVSDTPHSEAFLGELLISHGLAQSGDRVYTSADRGVSKHLGGIFTSVSKDFEPDTRFEHTGDSTRGDLAAPRVEGWNSMWLRGAQLSRYEELLETHARDTAAFSSWLAGASRLARLEAVERGVNPAVAEVSSGVLAPFMVGYALWVAAQAQRLGLKRLYYVSRDAEVMFKVARHVVGRVAPDIEVRYLYGSRQAWVLSASALSDDVLRRWLVVPPDSTGRTTLRRVGLDVERVHDETRLPFLRGDRADRVLLDEERRDLANKLLSEPLLSWVKAAAKEAADDTTAYLRQEGLYDGTPSALVDSGWGGMSAHAFDVVLGHGGVDPVSHMFVGRQPPTESGNALPDGKYLPWLFDQFERPQSTMDLQAPTVLVEMLCAGTEGRATGYTKTGDRWQPVLTSPSNDLIVAWGVENVHDVAERAAELVTDHLPAPASVDCLPLAWDGLSLFWNNPSDAEVAAWGTFPWEEEAALPFQAVAERVTTRSVMRRLMSGDRRLRRNSSWRAGTARISSQPWRSLFRSKSWLDDNRLRLRRAPRRLRLRLARLRRTTRRGSTSSRRSPGRTRIN